MHGPPQGLHPTYLQPLQWGVNAIHHATRHTPPMGIGRGTLQGDPLSPLLFDLMIELLILWLNAADKGYNITSRGLQLSSKWYADDGTLVTNSVDDLLSLLSIVQQFSE